MSEETTNQENKEGFFKKLWKLIKPVFGKILAVIGGIIGILLFTKVKESSNDKLKEAKKKVDETKNDIEEDKKEIKEAEKELEQTKEEQKEVEEKVEEIVNNNSTEDRLNSMKKKGMIK